MRFVRLLKPELFFSGDVSNWACFIYGFFFKFTDGKLNFLFGLVYKQTRLFLLPLVGTYKISNSDNDFAKLLPVCWKAYASSSTAFVALSYFEVIESLILIGFSYFKIGRTLTASKSPRNRSREVFWRWSLLMFFAYSRFSLCKTGQLCTFLSFCVMLSSRLVATIFYSNGKVSLMFRFNACSSFWVGLSLNCILIDDGKYICL